MELTFLNNIKSGLIKNEIIKSLAKLDTSLIIPALDNIMESIGLVEKEKQKDRTEVRGAIANKLMEVIRQLNGTIKVDKG